MALLNPNYVVSFDAPTMARIARLIEAEGTFRRYFLMAMTQSVLKVEGAAKDNASISFANPTGNLMRNIKGQVLAYDLGVVGVTRNVPYARRRELGFSGMTDALGRLYTNDPGFFYLRNALTASLPFISSAFAASAQLAVNSINVP